MFIEFFARKPVFAAVCSIIIFFIGLISIPSLPVAQYPQLAPPQITVTTNYIGANAQTVETAFSDFYVYSFSSWRSRFRRAESEA